MTQPETTARKINPLAVVLPLGALAAGAGAFALMSGPDTDRQSTPLIPQHEAVVVTQLGSEADIAPDAPIQPLGVGEPGDWRLGEISRHVVAIGDTDVHSEITVQASDFEPGRYYYPGPLVIEGDFTQDYVEVTASTITMDGDIAANNVRLIAEESAPEATNPHFLHYGGNEINLYADLTGWDHHYHRGDITVTGSIAGEGIDIVANQITAQGDVSGEVDLAASGGEYTGVLVPFSGRDPAVDFTGWKNESLTPNMYSESIRMPLVQPEEAITIGGTVTGDVTQTFPRMWAGEHGVELPTAASIAAEQPTQAAELPANRP
ncbi:MAG: hypothetical protein AAF213_02105 [Pseudomonadota bacterium]